LILGCSTKAGTYVSKQFHKAGYRVIIYDWANLPNKYSRYVSKYISVASPEMDLQAFEKKFIAYLQANPVDALLPLHDAALEIARHLKTKIPSGIKLLGLNPDETYPYAHNKWELLQLARQNEIPVPRSLYISELTGLQQDLPFPFPCIVKPVSSALIKNGRLYTFGVSVVKNRQELEDRVREVILNVPVMVQEFIEGYGIGFNFLAKDGELLNSYIHKRITEHGGVSSYREILGDTAFGNKEAISRLIAKIKWTGAGMLEFKVQNGIPVLMELNGRFFGSIELSVKSGLNLPKQFLELCLEQKTPQKNQAYNLNTRVRNLHDEVLLNLGALAKGKLGHYITWKLQVIRSIFRKNEFIEDNFFSDPGFVAGLYIKDLKRIAGKLRKKLQFRFFKISSHSWHSVPEKPSSIAFICLGNICRSPFAEAYARSLSTPHTFYSFGTYPHENRLSPVNAVSAARQFHISLEDHTSKYLRPHLIPAMDLFVVMDKLNYMALLHMDVPAEKIKFLSGEVIPDPYKKSHEQFVATYTTIKTNLDRILKK
jgi:protein-tyrosine-phosphatase/predicted ATP-grasp superfamily ATP-dependent carboligase